MTPSDGPDAAVTLVHAARAQLGESVAVYLDDGPAVTGLPSTIVDMTGKRPRILRSGAVGVDELREVVADIVDTTAAASS